MSEYQTYLDKCRHNRSVSRVVFVTLPNGGLRTFDEDAYVVQRVTGLQIRMTREVRLDVEPADVGRVVSALLGRGFQVELATPAAGGDYAVPSPKRNGRV